MKKYIALLRGINVGGKNTISMQLLKTSFEEVGFSGVRTYINSGNIFFAYKDMCIADLQQKCHQIISDKFNLDIPVAVIPINEFTDALSNAPEWWGVDKESTHNAIFIIPPASADIIIDAVGEAKSEYEQIASHGQVIFWTAARKTFSRTRWSKISSTNVYGSVTIRNANTAKKLLQLFHVE